MIQRALLVCGALSALLYVAMIAFVPMLYEGYSSTSQTVSELSAIGAPTRPLWIWLGAAYAAFAAAFGWGVLRSAGRSRLLQIAGVLMCAHGIVSFYWPPMHMRGVAFTLTDTMHIVWTIMTGLLMSLAIGFAAAALGKRFRIYSIATLVIVLAFGALTGSYAPRIAANLPTPWAGVWQRISIVTLMAWVLVLAIVLIRREESRGARAVS